jgi:multiple antibiotic resistance protein
MLYDLGAEAIGVFLALFPIVNPIGAVPIFYGLTSDATEPDRTRMALRIALYMAGILAAFMLTGTAILHFFGISLSVLEIAGGLIVAHTGWGMVAVSPRLSPPERSEAADKDDISFTPMALPLLAGPGAIGVLIGLSADFHGPEDFTGAFLGIIALCALTYALLRAGEPLTRALGPTGLGALSRILGFLILAIALNLIANGVFDLIKENGY